MKPLRHSPDLLAVAERVIWFEPPERALADPLRFLAYVMTYATAEEVAVVRDHVGEEGFREAIEKAPPGIIDARSWAYWTTMAGHDTVPPMPARRLPD